MKYVVLVSGILLLAVSACTKAVNVEAETTAVKSVLADYVKSVVQEDMNLYAKTVAPEPAMVNFGAFGAPIVGWDALKAVIDNQNATLSETSIDVSNLEIHVSEDGMLAWATCLWNFKAKMGENPIVLPLRCTWVLEKRAPGWVIVHFHKSLPTG